MNNPDHIYSLLQIHLNLQTYRRCVHSLWIIWCHRSAG